MPNEIDHEAFVAQAIERGERSGLWALSPADQIVYVISEAEVRCDMNGIDSFLGAYGAPGIALLADAYDAAGATLLASLLREVVTVLPDSGHASLQRANELITSREGYSYESVVAASRARSGEHPEALR